MTPQTDQLPVEWRQQINSESTVYGEGDELLEAGYWDGATTYALRAYRAERENQKLKEELNRMLVIAKNTEDTRSFVNWAIEKITQALQGEKEGKK